MNNIELPLKDTNLSALLKQTELEYILWALKQSNNIIAYAAELLGLQRTTLRMRMNRFGILMENKYVRAKKDLAIKTLRRENKLVDFSDDSQLSFW